jgi:phosphoribosylanthranilate isomerase
MTAFAPVILAGGLTPENVCRAIEVARPYAVDVASGVERSPGQKDYAKLRTFIEMAKRR